MDADWLAVASGLTCCSCCLHSPPPPLTLQADATDIWLSASDRHAGRSPGTPDLRAYYQRPRAAHAAREAAGAAAAGSAEGSTRGAGQQAGGLRRVASMSFPESTATDADYGSKFGHYHK